MRYSNLVRRFRSCLRNILGYSGHTYTRLNSSSHNRTSGKHACLDMYYFWRVEVPLFCGIPLAICTLYLKLSIALSLSFLLLFAAGLILLQWFESSLVYATDEPPKSRILVANPTTFGFSAWESVKLFPDGKNGPLVTGYLLLQSELVERRKSPTVLILHGNAGNAGHRLPMCQLMTENIHCNVFIIDYRGYGRSTGKPTEQGLYRDAEAALEYLCQRQDLDRKSIFVFGRSLGGAIAINLGTNAGTAAKICGVIIENSFTSLPEVAQHLFQPTFGFLTKYILPKWIFMNRFHSLSRLSLLNGQHVIPPFLFISGDCDTIIPQTMMRELASSYTKVRHFVRTSGNMETLEQPTASDCRPEEFGIGGRDGLVCFPNGKHNDTWLCDFWCDVIARFIQQSSLIPPASDSDEQIV